MLDGKRDGKIDAAFVVAVEKSGSGRYEFRIAVCAEKLNMGLANEPNIDGMYGPFWPLDPSDSDSTKKSRSDQA